MKPFLSCKVIAVRSWPVSFPLVVLASAMLISTAIQAYSPLSNESQFQDKGYFDLEHRAKIPDAVGSDRVAVMPQPLTLASRTSNSSRSDAFIGAAAQKNRVNKHLHSKDHLQDRRVRAQELRNQSRRYGASVSSHMRQPVRESGRNRGARPWLTESTN